MYVFTGVCLSTGGGCLQALKGQGVYLWGGGGSAYRGGCGLPTEGGGLPTVGVGQTHPKPEKRAVRILLECFLVRMNIIIKVYLH